MRQMCRGISAALAVAVVASAIGASAALAAPEWYGAGPEWRQAGSPLSEAATTVSKGKVKVSTASPNVTVECEVRGEGKAGPGVAGEEAKVTMSNCISVGTVTCGSPAMTATFLPWHSELVLVGGALRETLTGSGGSTGFKLTCTIEGIGKVTNTCLGSLGAGIATVSSGVEATLSGKELHCTVSGKNDGSIEGTQVLEAVTGGKLEATSAGVFTKLASALEAGRSGELKIEDKGFAGIGATCQFTTTGTIETLGLGKINTFSAQNCKLTGCSSPGSATPINLPWKTELYEAGGLRGRIVSGGSGTPEWSFSCVLGGIRVEDSCRLTVSPAVENLLNDVKDVFSEALTSTKCSHDANEGEAFWQGSLTVAPPASLGAIQVRK
ncbi:MAG: hypothetical protein ACTHM1_02835 [Solirubrobacteraceae bacterium]